MCGVIGWATPRPLDVVLLDPGLAALAHRGPDGSRRWSAATRAGGQVAVGHTRLSIIDMEGGAQPFFSHDRRFVISFNGEIYNYLELKQTLQAQGCRFITRSDTEVLLEAYRVWGEGCLTRLRGMFAFALYDTRTERLVLARDPFGKKPLFLADMAGGVAFASEIAPLLDLPTVERRLHTEVFGDYLLQRYVPGPATFFQGVRKLPPGCFAIVEKGVILEKRYFTPPLAQTPPRDQDASHAVTALRGCLEEAVRLRLRSDAPYGVFLSGGLDSSVIAALMTRQVGAVNSFAVGFEEAAYCELPHAGRVAARLGARHEALTVTAQDFAQAWQDAIRHRGAPVSEASDIPILLLSRAARGSVKMVLTGEGADELLAGYPKHRAEQWIGVYQALVPPGLHRRLLDPLIRRLPHDARRWKILSRALGADDQAQRARLWFASADPETIVELTGASLPPAHPLAASDSTLRQMMLADQTTWLPDNLLERGDRMMMAAGVDGNGRFGGAGGFAKESGFAVVGFDEIERQAGRDRQHEAGEAGAAAEVDASRRPGRQQWDQLQAVVDVALAQDRHIPGRDQVDGRVPAQQQGGEGIEPRVDLPLHVKHPASGCFT